MKQVLCLLYHRVSCLQEDVFNIAVTPETFESHMSFLSREYNIVRFEEDWNNIPDGKNIVITFDDGYYDNYYYALPILNRYKVPATFFITTGNIGTMHEFWWDKLITIISSEMTFPPQYQLKNDLYEYIWKTESYEKRLDMIKSVHFLMRRESFRSHDNWVSELEKWANVESEKLAVKGKNRPLSFIEFQEMAKNDLVTIGGHTIHHASLGGLTYNEQKEEIKGSIDKLRDLLGKDIEVFSYPFGGKCDYNQDTFRILEQCGIKKAATTEMRQCGYTDYKYEIPRCTVGECEIEVLEKKIAELFDRGGNNEDNIHRIL